MPNNLEKAKIFQQELDKQIVQTATSSWMEANAGQVKYNGGNEVKIPKISMDGLGDYDRSNGYKGGDVSLVFQTKTLTQDRGRSFSLDAVDVDETNFVATAGAVMGEFQRTKVAPEIDAYRYSKLAYEAIRGLGYTVQSTVLSSSNIIEALKADLKKAKRKDPGMSFVITMSVDAKYYLELAMAGKLTAMDFAVNGFNTKVPSFDSCPIIEVANDRLYDTITMRTGAEGQTVGGYIPASGAAAINWIICPRSLPIAVSKTDVPRIFDPLTNQGANAWKIDYRKFHDLWVKDNQLDSLIVNFAATPKAGCTATITATTDGATAVNAYDVYNGDQLIGSAGASANTFALKMVPGTYSLTLKKSGKPDKAVSVTVSDSDITTGTKAITVADWA